METHSVTMLGTGLIGDFYTMALHGRRGRDRVKVVCSRTAERGQAFSERWGIPNHTTSMQDAVNHPDTDVVVVALPNNLHSAWFWDADRAGGGAIVDLGCHCIEIIRNAMDEGRGPAETFYDGYVVNAVIDAAYRSAKSGQWETVEMEWRGGKTARIGTTPAKYEGKNIVKEEVLPGGRRKLILSDPDSGAITDMIVSG